MSNRRKLKRTVADPERRRVEAQVLIDQLLHGTPEGRVDPAITENLRKHLVAHNGQPDRALLAHFQEQIPGFDGVFPDDLE